MIRIESHYFVVGVIITDEIVVRAPPIVKYMKGWSVQRVTNYCEKKGWKMTKLPIL